RHSAREANQTIFNRERYLNQDHRSRQPEREPHSSGAFSWSNLCLSQHRPQTVQRRVQLRDAQSAQSAVQERLAKLHPWFQQIGSSDWRGSPPVSPQGLSHCPSEAVPYASPFDEQQEVFLCPRRWEEPFHAA